MGSLGWARCHWCWKWEYNMYIPDRVNGALCGDCLDIFIDGGEPPCFPNNRQRADRFFKAEWRNHQALSVIAKAGIAAFVADPIVP